MRRNVIKAVSRVNEVVTTMWLILLEGNSSTRWKTNTSTLMFCHLLYSKKKCFEAIVNHSLITDNLKDDIMTIMDSTVIKGYDVCGIQRLIQEAVINQVLLRDKLFSDTYGCVIRSMNVLWQKARHYPLSMIYLKEYVQRNINKSPYGIINSWSKINRSLANDTSFYSQDGFIFVAFAEVKGKEFSRA